jgi:glucose-1-phosphate thymidylyltransferase
MKQAIILAAGEGQRLRPFTVSKPKVMLAVAGKPILQYMVEALAACGIRDIVIVAGYRREQIFDLLGDGADFGVGIRYVIQERQVGTAHALKQAEALAQDEFIVLPGDHLIEAETIRDFLPVSPMALLVKQVPEAETVRYGVVATDEGLVKAIVEKPREPCAGPVSTGIFSLKKEVFDYIGNEPDMPAVINRMVSSGHHFQAIETKGIWLDAVYPWDVLVLNNHALGSLSPAIGGLVEHGVGVRGVVSLGAGSLVRSGSYVNGPALIGCGCDIGPTVVIGPGVSIGDNVTIGPFSVIENSIIGDDVAIGPGAVIQDSVIDSGCRIGTGFKAASDVAEIRIADEFHRLKAGVLMGENCRIGSGVVAQAGAIVGNNCTVTGLKVLSGGTPDGSRVV